MFAVINSALCLCDVPSFYLASQFLSERQRLVLVAAIVLAPFKGSSSMIAWSPQLVGAPLLYLQRDLSSLSFLVQTHSHNCCGLMTNQTFFTQARWNNQHFLGFPVIFDYYSRLRPMAQEFRCSYDI